MKLWPLSLILLGGYGLLAPTAQSTRKDVLVIYGNVEGYLSPCGCTYPMSGGIQRMGSFLKELKGTGDQSFTLVIPGGNVDGVGEQNEFKAECIAETAQVMGAAALGYSEEEAALGTAGLLEMSQLSHDKMLCTGIQPSQTVLVNPQISTNNFLVESFSPRISDLAAQIGAQRLPVSDPLVDYLGKEIRVACFDGDQIQAKGFAHDHPEFGVVIYRSTSDPPAAPVQVGKTLLVTPGFHGKNVVTLTFEDGKLQSYGKTLLGPDFKNDPDISEVYSSYLERVGSAHLLQKLPRVATAAYAGSQSCRSCHEKAYQVWSESGHSHAYKDLRAQGHGLDPDCVSCHVVGLSSKLGFISAAHTPQFASAGCESCHGPGLSHVLHPRTFLMPKVNQSTCVSCHTVENSPGFDYATFWPKIAH